MIVELVLKNEEISKDVEGKGILGSLAKRLQMQYKYTENGGTILGVSS